MFGSDYVSQKWNCAASLFPKQNYNVLFPSFHIHVLYLCIWGTGNEAVQFHFRIQKSEFWSLQCWPLLNKKGVKFSNYLLMFWSLCPSTVGASMSPCINNQIRTLKGLSPDNITQLSLWTCTQEEDAEGSPTGSLSRNGRGAKSKFVSKKSTKLH